MIGKSLSERHGLVSSRVLAPEQAVAIVTSALTNEPRHARALVEVRAQGAEMIACLFVRADKPTLRLAKELGFRMKPGATVVFGLSGTDAAGILPDLSQERRAWLESPCGAKETKVFLVAGGIALVSIDTSSGKAVVEAGP